MEQFKETEINYLTDFIWLLNGGAKKIDEIIRLGITRDEFQEKIKDKNTIKAIEALWHEKKINEVKK